MSDGITRDLFEYTIRNAEIARETGWSESVLDMMEERDRELEHFLELYVKGTVTQHSQAVSSSQMAGTEVTLATYTVSELPYPRRFIIKGTALVFGAATTAGVTGDVWEFRIYKDGVLQRKTRIRNSVGSTWNETGTVEVIGQHPADTSHTWTFRIARVSGSGGCRTFTDSTTNHFDFSYWPESPIS